MKKECLLYKVKSDGNSWFLGNTFAILIDDFRPKMSCGMFVGTLQCSDPASQGRQYGSIDWDEDLCDFDEFEEEPFGTVVLEW
jgi:hypothetical protein